MEKKPTCPLCNGSMCATSARCYRCSPNGVNNLKHGMWGTRIHRIWGQMVARCRNPKHADYQNYGGRGIAVCERWLTFANFYADMGEKPEGLSLDRTDNDGNYEPGNCRWATSKEQHANMRPRKAG